MLTKLFDQPAEAELNKTKDSSREDSVATSHAKLRHELWLLLSLFGIAFLLNSLVDAHRMVLGSYTLPTLYSA